MLQGFDSDSAGDPHYRCSAAVVRGFRVAHLGRGLAAARLTCPEKQQFHAAICTDDEKVGEKSALPEAGAAFIHGRGSANVGAKNVGGAMDRALNIRDSVTLINQNSGRDALLCAGLYTCDIIGQGSDRRSVRLSELHRYARFYPPARRPFAFLSMPILCENADSIEFEHAGKPSSSLVFSCQACSEHLL